MARRDRYVLDHLGHRPQLDGLRAVAVAAVVAIHSLQVFDWSWSKSFLTGGFAGVDLFFVLSGFLITSLLLEEWKETGQISVPRFYARRALRLLPALFVVVVAQACYSVATGNQDWWSGAASDWWRPMCRTSATPSARSRPVWPIPGP